MLCSTRSHPAPSERQVATTGCVARLVQQPPTTSKSTPRRRGVGTTPPTPGYSGFGHHHNQSAPSASDPNQIFKIFCRANENYCLTVRYGNVVLAPVNPKDEHHHWYKDMWFSTKVKDEEGMLAFALVNKATGLAIKHSLGQSNPVKLVPFCSEYKDVSVLWTESKDAGKGFRYIRMVNNTRLNFDAFHNDKDHGGVHDGTTIVLWEWCKGENQSWKILPWGPEKRMSGKGEKSVTVQWVRKWVEMG